MSDWFETLDSLFATAWQVMADARGDARQIGFATVGADGWPETRIVVLRDVDAGAQTLSIHTDRYSGKLTSLRDNPRAALVYWDQRRRLQLRLQADVFIQTGQSAAEAWARVPDPSRQSYGTSPAPGTPIKGALEYTKPCLQSAFAVLSCRVVTMDVVHLGDAHRRAKYSRDGDWAGQWLSP